MSGPEGIPAPFEATNQGHWWFNHGRPKQVGDLVEVKMASGWTAVFMAMSVKDSRLFRGMKTFRFEFVRYVPGSFDPAAKAKAEADARAEAAIRGEVAS